MQLYYNNIDNHDSTKMTMERINNKKKMINTKSRISFCGSTAQLGPRPPRFEVSRLHSVTHTPGKSPLNEFPALADATTNTELKKYIRPTSMPSVGFEPAIPGIEWPQT
jgi:hypothetical protein